MSIFEGDTPGQDSIAPDDAARGPRLGFLGSLEQSYNAQLVTAGTYRVEAALQEQEANQIQLARQYGADIQPINRQQPLGAFSIWNSNPYWRAATGMSASAGPDGAAPDNSPITTQNDAVLSDLAKKHPQAGFKTYAQMMSDVAANARNVQYDEQNTSHTWSGAIGSFLGSTGSMFNLRYSSPAALALSAAPNVLAVGTGPLGVAARIGASGAVNAAISGAQNLAGDQDESRVLGMAPQSFGSAIGSGFVSGLAAGAGGEALGAGLRFAGRQIAPWFENRPNDPAPTPPRENQPLSEVNQTFASENAVGENQPAAPRPGYPGEGPEVYGPPVPVDGDPVIEAAQSAQPYGPTREAAARVEQDLSSVSTQLDAWDGPGAAEVQQWAGDRFVGTPEARADMVQNGADINEIARRVDPATVGEFQDAGQQMTVLRDQIDTLQGISHSPVADAEILQQRQSLSELDEQVAQLQQQAQTGKGRNAARAAQQAEDLSATRSSLAQQSQRLTSTEKAARTASQIDSLRQQLAQLDERRRDLAPLVSRAYRIAQDQVNEAAPRPIEDILPSIHNVPGEDTAERLARATEHDITQQTEEAARVVLQTDDEPTQRSGEDDGPPPDSRTAIPQQIRLPSGRIVSASDVVSATRDENGATQVTSTVADLLREVEEAKQLAEASTSCAI